MSEKYNFFHKVFCRVVLSRLKNDTFNATNPAILELLQRRCTNPIAALEIAIDRQDEDRAFYWFESLFSWLNPHQQKALSGLDRNGWLDMDREYRGV